MYLPAACQLAEQPAEPPPSWKQPLQAAGAFFRKYPRHRQLMSDKIDS
jgi:hypothetical protein